MWDVAFDCELQRKIATECLQHNIIEENIIRIICLSKWLRSTSWLQFRTWHILTTCIKLLKFSLDKNLLHIINIQNSFISMVCIIWHDFESFQLKRILSCFLLIAQDVLDSFLPKYYKLHIQEEIYRKPL